MAFGLGEPVRKALLRPHAVAQMPLSAQPTGVPVVGKNARQVFEFADRAIGVLPHLGARPLATEIAVHSVLGRYEPGQESGTTWRTDRVHAISLAESHTVRGESINMWRADIFVAVASEGPGALIIGDDENDVKHG